MPKLICRELKNSNLTVSGAEPLYYVDEDGSVLDGQNEESPSFFQEYNWKLKHVYDKFYSDRAKAIAKERRGENLWSKRI